MPFTTKRIRVLVVMLASSLLLQSQCVALAATGESAPVASKSLAEFALSASAAGNDVMSTTIASAVVPSVVADGLATATEPVVSPPGLQGTESNASGLELASLGAPGLEIAPPASMQDASEGSGDQAKADMTATTTNDGSSDHIASDDPPLTENHFSINADPNSMKLALANDNSAIAAAGDTLKGGVTVEPTATLPQIDSLTRQILLKEIELERFNLHYKMEAAKQGRWKGWRYSFFGETNAMMGLTGGIIGTAERGSHLRSPKAVHTSMQENACTIPQIGAWIGAGAALLEFGINEWHDFKAMEHGFSPRAARAHVNALKADIDKLLAERDALAED